MNAYKLSLQLLTTQDAPPECNNPAKIRFCIQDQKKREIFTAIDKKWDADFILKWLLDNKLSIMSETPPFDIKTDESIPMALESFYAAEDAYEDSEVTNHNTLWDKIYAYRTRHALRFAFRGADLDDVYLGLNRGEHEISCADGLNTWRFVFDVVDFYDNLPHIVDNSKI